jgi:hypothetical protein
MYLEHIDMYSESVAMARESHFMSSEHLGMSL